jgi:microcystin-dependent protein
MNNTDDHLRLIKSTVKATFPNITGAVTATHTQLNGAGALFTNGAGVLADAGVFFKTSGDGFVNTLAGDIDVKLQGTIAATFQRTGGANFFKITGQVEATTLKGGGIAPVGSMIMWLSDTLPPSDEGTWVWANGLFYAKATYPTAYTRIGDTYGATSTHFAVINMQEVAPVGKGTMGGAASPGLLASIAAGVKNVLNGLFGADTVTLNSTQMPVHYHSANIFDTGHGHGTQLFTNNGVTGGSTVVAYTAVTASSLGGSPPATFNSNSAVTGVRVNSSNGLDTTYSAGGGLAHNNTQPSRTVNFIVRLA